MSNVGSPPDYEFTSDSPDPYYHGDKLIVGPSHIQQGHVALYLEEGTELCGAAVTHFSPDRAREIAVALLNTAEALDPSPVVPPLVFPGFGSDVPVTPEEEEEFAARLEKAYRLNWQSPSPLPYMYIPYDAPIYDGYYADDSQEETQQ